ncbi:MAG: Na+/H+ antiporter NhaA, partial [Muribaculaceae bacterium]|nr:Na+/H+ antiporter NhaA [Muribaculaceae bacterium]
SSLRHAMLPIVAAIGGMALPVAIFACMSVSAPYSGGAAIPMATDIAFTLGVLAMFGSRMPVSLKIFLTTLAVVDDIGGIAVIATVYTHGIEWPYIVAAVVSLCVLMAGSAMHIKSKIFYLGIGGIVWFLTLNSGIHPTIAGVLVAFCVPATPVFAPKKYIRIIRGSIAHFRSEDDETLSKRTILSREQLDWLKVIESASDKVISPLQELEDSLHPVVNYFIVPLFAFANAGIYLLDFSPAMVFGGVSVAIMVSLGIGKFLGIFLFSWVAIRTGVATMPENTTWRMLASVAVLGCIGFTVSLFIASLTFDTPSEAMMLDQAKLGIVVGSLVSGVAGYFMRGHSLRRRDRA